MKILTVIKETIPTPLRNLLKKMVFTYRSVKIRRRGILVLNDILGVLNHDKPKAFAVFGTLLGLYREKGLLAHDIDIDIACFYEDLPDIIETLSEIGINFIYKFQDNDFPEQVEYRFFYKDIPFDIFVFHKATSYVYCTDFVRKSDEFFTRELRFEHFDLASIVIDGHSYVTPSNPEKFLASRYGPSFMTPDRSFDYKNPAPCIFATKRKAKMIPL